MTSRSHNNRSGDTHPATSQEGHQGEEDQRDRSGTDERHDGKSRQNGGGDGAGGAPKQQGQGQANKGIDSKGQNRGHGGRG